MSAPWPTGSLTVNVDEGEPYSVFDDIIIRIPKNGVYIGTITNIQVCFVAVIIFVGNFVVDFCFVTNLDSCGLEFLDTFSTTPKFANIVRIPIFTSNILYVIYGLLKPFVMVRFQRLHVSDMREAHLVVKLAAPS